MDLSPTKKLVLTGAAALGIVLGAAGVTAAVTNTTSATPSGVSSTSGAQTTTDKPEAERRARRPVEQRSDGGVVRGSTETCRSGGLARAAAWAGPHGQGRERPCGAEGPRSAGQPSRDDVREPVHPQVEA